MCDYFSCIITRDLKCLWLPNNPTDHEAIIQHYKLDDTKIADRDFVRIEINPKNKDKITRNQKDWQGKVDEEDTLPSWFKKAKKQATEQCWQAWKESVKINIAIDEIRDIKNSFVVARGSSKVVARGSSKVVAWDSSKVEAWDSSTVEIQSETSVVQCHGKIYVHLSAQVIKKLQVNAKED